VLTGNIRPLAHAKLGALGLIGYLDMDIGAYGDDHEIRAELVHIARRSAAESLRRSRDTRDTGNPCDPGDPRDPRDSYRAGEDRADISSQEPGPFAGTATVLVGDTPLDVEAALATGSRAVAVATGSYSADELAAAGAHAVLPDLADTARVLDAILGLPEGTAPPPQ